MTALLLTMTRSRQWPQHYHGYRVLLLLISSTNAFHFPFHHRPHHRRLSYLPAERNREQQQPLSSSEGSRVAVNVTELATDEAEASAGGALHVKSLVQ